MRATSPPDVQRRRTGPEHLDRFDGLERVVHWTTALLFGVLVATAAVLYLPSVASAVGLRSLMRDVHVGAGYLLPVPLLAGLAGRWGRRLRGDVSELNYWDTADRRWLRSRGRDPAARPGKFNAGQKLNAGFVAGATLVMLATGSMLRWPSPFPVSWRTGATFVHDWLAIAFVVVIAGHVVMAVARPQSLRGMLTGEVARSWAERHHPRWAAPTAGPGTGEGPANRRWWRKALPGAAAGCATVLALGALMPAWSRDGSSESASDVARRFQAALERNDWEAAFGMMGPRARSGQSRDAYFAQRLLKQEDPILDPGESEPYASGIDVTGQHRIAGTTRVLLQVRMSDGRTAGHQVDLRRLDGRWRVEVFRPVDQQP